LFRLKIALLSALISGLVLVGFGLYFLTLISTVGLDRIDREINALGESQLHVWHSKRHWEDFEGSLRSIYGSEKWRDLIVRVTDADHQILYQSPHWPAEITTAAFPGFDTQMEKGPGSGAGETGPPGERFENPPRPEREPNGQPPREIRRPPRPREDPDGRPPEPTPSQGSATRIKKQVFRTLATSTGTWRTGIMGNQHVTIVLGMDLAGYYKDADRFKRAFLTFLPLALLLLVAGGWLIAHRALEPVAAISKTAQQITARGLDQRVPEGKADSELLNLIQVINSMLERLEKSFNQATRFSADAAHELQTPLTVLQGILDDAVQHCPADSEEQRRYGSLLEEVQRLKSIVQKLLILARADSDQLLPRWEAVDLSGMIESAVEDASALDSQIKIEMRVARGVVLQGDNDLLRLVVHELTKNAVKYNLEGGVIRYELAMENNAARLTIENSANPIPAEDREHIFERFYRVDKSRSKRVPGTGLGLSLAREIVRAHKGELRLDPAKPRSVSFSLRLPIHQ
jgi:two-component system, OmpR family, heavy metal sensor histidine kinase CusS